MNRQEVFDKVSIHLMTQGKKAHADSFCVYRTDNGLKCAIGCLIPDHLYDSKIEGLTIRNLMELNPRQTLLFKNILETELGTLNEDDLIFLKDLQLIHDFNNPDTWKEKLENLAEDSNLVFELKENENADN